MKFLLGNLNLNPCSPHLINTYTCGVIIVSRVCGMKFLLGNLNPDSCFPHSIKTYNCGVIIASKVRGIILNLIGDDHSTFIFEE